MRLLRKPLQNITSDDILYLTDNQIQESIDLDYKKELPSNSLDDKKEFLADISSFANAFGGIIVYGIEELRDEKNQNTGLPGEIVGLGTINMDREALRLGSMIRDGLDPHLNNVEFKDINVNDKLVLLIGIPRSLFAPHMISFRGSGKFFSRHNSEKFKMDAREIKQSFLQTNEWENAANNFRIKRIIDVRSLKFIPNLETEGSYFVHIFPLGSNRTEIELKKHTKLLNDLHPPTCYAWNKRFNLDGFLVYGGHEKCNSYIQYFRNGGVELYTTRLYDSGYEREPPRLYGNDVEKVTVRYIEKLFTFLPELRVGPPLIIYLSIMDLKNVGILEISRNSGIVGKFDRDEILLPGLIVDNLDIDISELLHQNFDILWQAAGLSESPNYKDGIWTLKE